MRTRKLLHSHIVSFLGGVLIGGLLVWGVGIAPAIRFRPRNVVARAGRRSGTALRALRRGGLSVPAVG